MKLKKLFIGLFWLLAFTPFVLADSVSWYPQSYYFTPWISQVLWNYSYTFDNFGNMFTDNWTVISDSAFYQCWSYSYSVFHNYAWLNWKLYYYSEGNNWNITQWFVNNWCVSDFSNPWSCYAWPFDVSWEDVKDNIWTITSIVYWSNSLNWWNCSSNTPQLLCFGDGTSYYCANCMNNSNYLVCWLSDSMNFDFAWFNDISSYNWSSSPFVINDDSSDIILIDDSITWTNKEIYNAFLKRWYYKWLCYADYYTWNLVQSWDYISDLFQWDLEDSTYYWDSVFDFYLSENSSLSTHSWSQQRYYLMKYTYEQNNLTPFIWYNKGTWNIMFNIYNNHFNDNFSWIDYRTFCDMTVNWFSDNDIFTWDISDSMNSYVDRIRSEQTFVLSGVDFSWANTLLWVFNQLYTRAKNVFLLDNSNSGVVGILPTYIIFGFFLFVLLYWLKR